VGVLGALFQPEKSIFCSISSCADNFPSGMAVERLTPEVRAYGVTSVLLLLAYICFTRDTRTGAATLPGATAMFRPPWNW